MFESTIPGVGDVRITPLNLGSLTVPAGTPMGGTVLPVRAFLIVHPQGAVLFDTGFGAAHPAFDRRLSARRRSLARALEAAGARLDAIDAVINCHLHYDHAGGNPNFPGTPILIQRREYQAAAGLDYVVADRVHFPASELRLLEGEAEVMPGLLALPTPGHTPGHQSLVIDARGGPVIIAGQAAYTAAEFDDPHREPARGLKTASDPAAFLRSIEQLRACAPQRVYFSHDAGC